VAHLVLIVAALPPVIVHAKAAFAVYIMGVVLLGIGFGGITYAYTSTSSSGVFDWLNTRPNIATLLLEQLPNTGMQVSVDKKGRKVLVDPLATRSRMLLYFFCLVSIGSMTSVISMVYCEMHVGFWLACTIPTVVFLACPFILWRFRDHYAKMPPEGSVFVNCCRLCALAMEGRWSWNPVRM
jgi:POT family proton-dependent oligopeptide transporter